MSFLLDPPALLLIGFLAGKGYYLLTAFADRLFKRGAAKRDLMLFGALVVVIFWAYSALLYLNVIYFPWPLPHWYGGTDWMLNSGLPLGLARSATTDALAVVVFATYPVWFYLGTELGLAGHRLADGPEAEGEGQDNQGARLDDLPGGGSDTSRRRAGGDRPGGRVPPDEDTAPLRRRPHAPALRLRQPVLRARLHRKVEEVRGPGGRHRARLREAEVHAGLAVQPLPAPVWRRSSESPSRTATTRGPRCTS